MIVCFFRRSRRLHTSTKSAGLNATGTVDDMSSPEWLPSVDGPLFCFLSYSKGDVTAQYSDGFRCGSYRTVIPWVRMLALLVSHWMHRVAVLVNRLAMYIFRAVSEDFCLLPVVYIYPPLDNNGQYYILPSKNHSGDLDCDCNTVMYKCEVQTTQGDHVLICLLV